MVDINVIAFYLPQFHEIPENNMWWGKGFTEWVNVKSAKPLFEGHIQPKIPKNNNYYDLSDVNAMKWQTEIAKENGIDGFCFYHYWFDDKPLLEKPLINFLQNGDIDFPYCFCWANESWTNGWAKSEASVILEQTYGDKKIWKVHFDFLLPFFKDKRYIKENNCPLLVIYRPYLCAQMMEMLEFWKDLCVQNGFDGLKIASQRFEKPEEHKKLYDYLDYHIEYQPAVGRALIAKKSTMYKKARQKMHDAIYKLFNKDISFHQNLSGPVRVSYDEVWEAIVRSCPSSKKSIAGAFVNWDNTPRHKRRGTVYVGSSPQKFENYMIRQLEHVDRDYASDYLFIFAWNEWGEGGYLEPDEHDGCLYLEAIKKAKEKYKRG